MPKFNLYSAWMDTDFYFWALLFSAALFALIYSIRKYLELANLDFSDEEIEGDAAGSLPAPEAQPQSYAAAELAAPPETAEQPELQGAPSPAAESAAPSPAESFVRGIYEGISGLDARLKDIEASLLKGRSGNEFAVKFLEDMASDIDSLDKAKIKARIEYLLSDLKK